MAVSIDQFGRATWAGTSRSVAAFIGENARQPADFTLTIPIGQVSHCVRLCLFDRANHDTGWRMGIFDDAGTKKLSIRRIGSVTPGVYEAFAGPRTATLTATAGQPATLICDVRGQQLTLTLRRSGAADVSLTYTNVVNPTFDGYFGWGLESNVDGATAGPCEVTEYLQTPQTIDPVPYVIAGGQFYARYGDSAFQPVGNAVFSTVGRVVSCVRAGSVIALSQESVWKVDVVNRTVTRLIASAGDWLDGNATSTKAGIILEWADRLVTAAGRFLLASAVDTETDLDTGSALIGGAFAEPFNEPIVAANLMPGGNLLIGMPNRFAMIVGDNTTSTAQKIDRSVDAGPSGQDAALTTAAGVMVHTAAGLMRFGEAGDATNLSSSRLRTFLQPSQIAPLNVTYHLARDPQRQTTFVFRQSDDGISLEHVVYDEVSDIFLVDTYPQGWNVSRAAQVMGEMWIGFEDGYVRRYSRTAQMDQGGGSFGIDARLPMMRLDDDGLMTDVRLRWLQLLMSTQSTGDVTVNVYMANDVESVYDVSRRTTIFTGFWQRGDTPMLVDQSAPVLLVELSAGAGVSWAVEYAEVGVERLPASYLNLGTAEPVGTVDLLPGGGSSGVEGAIGPGNPPAIGGEFTPPATGGGTPPSGGSTGTISPGGGGTVAEGDGTTPPGTGTVGGAGTISPGGGGTVGEEGGGTTPTVTTSEGGTIEPGPGGTVPEPGETPVPEISGGTLTGIALGKLNDGSEEIT